MPGTADPVDGADEVVAFAKEYGLPVAIKAAYGGGGRGLKVARTIEEIPDLFESAVREAVTAFGRGECFVERFLDKPRHVETQCLADQHGNVVVVSTRDCSLQRRNQKLVEEAPAPFLTDEQHAELLRASKAILREAGYVGAGTCEFLVGPDGAISFLEVNTRLQVEHPVTEEVTGIDLVREQFRIADGEPLGYDDPEPHAHSIEFRINGEDAGRGFLPAPGTVTRCSSRRRAPASASTPASSRATSSAARSTRCWPSSSSPAGPASRRSSGHAARWTSSSSTGMPTVLPFHRAVVHDAAFAPATDEPFTIHTRWIETEFDNTIEPYAGGSADAAEAERAPDRSSSRSAASGSRSCCPPGSRSAAVAAAAAASKKAPRAVRRRVRRAAASGDALTAPMQGTIVKIAVEEGADGRAGRPVVVLEAMKMEQPINAHKAGVVSPG